MIDIRYAPINEWLDTFDSSVLTSVEVVTTYGFWHDPIFWSILYDKFTFKKKINGEFFIDYEYIEGKFIRLRFMVHDDRSILHKRISNNGQYEHTMERYIHDLINEEDYFQQSTIRDIPFTWKEIYSFCTIMNAVLPYFDKKL